MESHPTSGCVDRVIRKITVLALGRGVVAYVAASPDLGWAADALLRLDKHWKSSPQALVRRSRSGAPDELLNILVQVRKAPPISQPCAVSRSRATPPRRRVPAGLIRWLPRRAGGSSGWSRTSCRTSASAACGATMTRSLLAVAGGGVAAQLLARLVVACS